MTDPRNGVTSNVYTNGKVTSQTDALAALSGDGTVWGWGNDLNGQLGDGVNLNDGSATNKSVPVQTNNLSGVTSLSAGNALSIARKSDGTAWAWGQNIGGSLGNGTSTSSSVPVRVGSLTGVTAVAAGGSHGLAVKSDGTVWRGDTTSTGSWETARTRTRRSRCALEA